MDVIPMAADQIFIGPVAEERRELALAGTRLEGIEFTIRKARNSWLEVQAKHRHDAKDDIGNTTAIHMKR